MQAIVFMYVPRLWTDNMQTESYDYHCHPLGMNRWCSYSSLVFMSSSLSPSQDCTPQFCFAFIQTFTAYLYHQTIISMKAELIFSCAYWIKAQWLPVVGHFSMYYSRKCETGRKGSHQLVDAGNQVIRTLHLLRTAPLCFSLHASLQFHGGKVVYLAHTAQPVWELPALCLGRYYGITLPSHDLCHSNQFPSEKLKLELRCSSSVRIP